MFVALEKVGPLPIQTYAQAMTIEPDGDAVYIIGGWGSDSQCSVLRLELPDDLCSLWSTKFSCLRMSGCGFCAYKIGEEVTSEICHSNAKECPLSELPSNGTITVLLLMIVIYYLYCSFKRVIPGQCM